MDQTYKTAKAFYEKTAQVPYPKAFEPSPLWIGNITQVLIPTINSATSATEICKLITGEVCYSFPTKSTHHLAGHIVDKYMEWFDKEGASLSSFDFTIQESPYTDDSVIIERKGRRISTAFLWHLGIAYRISSKLPKCKSHLEIGSGYGGLARIIKLMHPGQTYYMIDMDVSLYFSYVYLQTNFPEAKCLLVDEVEKVKQINDGHDFVFIPTQFAEALKGFEFDVVINTQSLSEMTQSAYDRFMQLLQNEIEVRYFYNANRYGPHPDGLTFHDRIPEHAGMGNEEASICSCASALDPHWRTIFWDLHGEDSLTNIDPRIMIILELIVERIPKAIRNDDYNKVLSQQLLKSWEKQLKLDEKSHYYLWESIRYHPTKASLETYIQLLELKGFQQCRHYKKLLSQISPG